MSTYNYKVKKGEFELDTDDRELVLRILGIAATPIRIVSKPQIPKKKEKPSKKVLKAEDIKETLTSFVLSPREFVSRACVAEILVFLRSRGEPVISADIHKALPKYSKSYINRALRLLIAKKQIEKLRVPDKKFWVYRVLS